jgi:hypothetical protein
VVNAATGMVNEPEKRRNVMKRSRANVAFGFLLGLSLLGEPVVALAQEFGKVHEEKGVVSPRHQRTFGTTSDTSHTVGAFAFTGVDAASSAFFSSNTLASRFCTGVPCIFNAPVLVPAGALVTVIELDACDTNAAGSVTANLFRNVDLEAGTTSLVTVSTGTAETPGCAFFFQDLPIPETIDNFNNTYIAQVTVEGTDSTTRFWGVRVYYRLQVSPAPATATFSDVPTSHPFFQFIETLVAAGVTQGCSLSPPRYCPDDPLTRGQAAVFFGRALGLQFAP